MYHEPLLQTQEYVHLRSPLWEQTRERCTRWSCCNKPSWRFRIDQIRFLIFMKILMASHCWCFFFERSFIEIVYLTYITNKHHLWRGIHPVGTWHVVIYNPAVRWYIRCDSGKSVHSTKHASIGVTTVNREVSLHIHKSRTCSFGHVAIYVRGACRCCPNAESLIIRWNLSHSIITIR